MTNKEDIEVLEQMKAQIANDRKWLALHRAIKALEERPQTSNNAELFKQTFGIYATELWTMSEADFLKWLNQKIPQFEVDEIPTFNREELEKARDYWYNHLEVGNEEQNEAAWAAINAIKYCIEHSSGYQKGAEND